MRDHLTHRHFMTKLEIIRDTIDNDLDLLLAAVDRMLTRSAPWSTRAEAADLE